MRRQRRDALPSSPSWPRRRALPAQPYPAVPSPARLVWQEGVQYPMSADEVWLHKLILEVDRARKHDSKHVTTALVLMNDGGGVVEALLID